LSGLEGSQTSPRRLRLREATSGKPLLAVIRPLAQPGQKIMALPPSGWQAAPANVPACGTCTAYSRCTKVGQLIEQTRHETFPGGACLTRCLAFLTLERICEVLGHAVKRLARRSLPKSQTTGRSLAPLHCRRDSSTHPLEFLSSTPHIGGRK
jgi:hypothetical protein